MGVRSSLLVTAMAAALTAVPCSAAVTDCPLRDMPFSLASPLIDILLNPAAAAAVRSETPAIGKLPAMMTRTTAPSFAAIVTPRDMAALAKIDDTQLAALDRKLKAIPVTDADRVARCARYDDDRPVLTPPAGRPRILLFEKMTGFRDGPSVDAAHAAFVAMARANGWSLVSTDRGGAMNPATLARFDLVIWNNVSGDVLTLSQRKAFRAFVQRGGGYVGIHGSAGDSATFWDWYVDDLIGARFAGHPFNPQFQDARILTAEGSTVADGLPGEWMMKDEWYSFKTTPRDRGSAIVATLDESSYSPRGYAGDDLRMGDHPIAWTRCVGRGRVFYSAIGHRPDTYSDPHHVTLLKNAIGWAADGRKQGCTAPAAQ